METRKIALCLALAGAAAAFSPGAAAATASFSFSECLAGCDGSIASAATLTLTDIAGGVSFSLTSSSPGGSFISGLYFNGTSGHVDNTGSQTLGGFTYSTSASAESFTSAAGYNWDFSFPTAKSKDRLLAGETASWTITGNGVDVTDFSADSKLMVHLQGVTGIGSDTSVKLAGVFLDPVASVPEPGNGAMLAAGLGLVGAVVRRRSRQR